LASIKFAETGEDDVELGLSLHLWTGAFGGRCDHHCSAAGRGLDPVLLPQIVAQLSGLFQGERGDFVAQLSGFRMELDRCRFV
jgi:hypothetical protein